MIVITGAPREELVEKGVLTQLRPLKLLSSNASLTICHASSSVRCAVKIAGSLLAGTLQQQSGTHH